MPTSLCCTEQSSAPSSSTGSVMAAGNHWAQRWHCCTHDCWRGFTTGEWEWALPSPAAPAGLCGMHPYGDTQQSPCGTALLCSTGGIARPTLVPMPQRLFCSLLQICTGAWGEFSSNQSTLAEIKPHLHPELNSTIYSPSRTCPEHQQKGSTENN